MTQRTRLDDRNPSDHDEGWGSVTRWDVEWTRAAVVVLLAGSVGLLVAAPSVIDGSYSWLEHTTSESAGQGVEEAWVARLGLLFFGFAVLWLARLRATAWGTTGTLLHQVWGVSMIAAATFASRSWLPEVAYDDTEDLLHSVASFSVGVSFTVGVLVVGMRRARLTGRARWFDLAAFILAPVISLAMTGFGEFEGLLQRAMFAIAYVWYLREAISASDLSADEPHEGGWR